MSTPAVPPPYDPNAEFPPKTVKNVKIAGIAALVTVFAAVAIFIVVKVLNPPAPAFAAGDCVEVVNGGQYAAQIEKVDCGSDAALYEVGVYLDDPDAECPGEDYARYQQTGGNQQSYQLCMMLNVADGDCLEMPMISAGQEKKVACASDEANVAVTKVIEGTADRSGCPAESAENARVYPDPKRTVCLGRAPV
ncbi:hypothetical protein [Actinophytocola sp. NPDC049390]|uniref:LppU/SCO3897 family protein n=1 Tax=Actinophytocola sp. NPDC049390 TaxID=3363894 RepID=UPI0037AEE4A5